ncbi:hypothetical protein AKJ16_DCAP26280 [Drosera capensis]
MSASKPSQLFPSHVHPIARPRLITDNIYFAFSWQDPCCCCVRTLIAWASSLSTHICTLPKIVGTWLPSLCRFRST